MLEVPAEFVLRAKEKLTKEHRKERAAPKKTPLSLQRAGTEIFT